MFEDFEAGVFWGGGEMGGNRFPCEIWKGIGLGW